MEIQRYLKTGIEFVRGREVIQINTDIVQAVNTRVYGYLCLFVLKSLGNGEQFQTILDHMKHYGSGYTYSYWRDTIQTEELYVERKVRIV